MVQGAGDGEGHACSYALRVSGAMCGIQFTQGLHSHCGLEAAGATREDPAGGQAGCPGQARVDRQNPDTILIRWEARQ